MKKDNFHSKISAVELIFEYEAMSHEGTVGFLEEKDFSQIIRYYQQEEELTKALAVVQQALLQHSYSGSFHIVHAELLLEIDEPDLALDALDQAEVFAPNTLEIKLIRAEAFAALNNLETALLILEAAEVEADLQEKGEIYFCKACIYEHFRIFSKMFDALRIAVLSDPGNSRALERLWLGVELSRRYSDSVVLHNQLVDKDPYCYISWYNLGHAYSCLGQHQNAAKAFEYAYLINDSFEFAYRDCAESWIRLRAFEKAIRCYEEALEHFSADSGILLKMGYCYEQLSELRKAKIFYIDAARIDESNDEVYYRLGCCFSREGRFKSAVWAFAKANCLDDRKEEYALALGNTYFQSSEKEKSIDWFKKVVEIAPDQLTHWTRYAYCLLQLENVAESLLVLKEAAFYTPCTELLYCQVACLFKLNRKQEALFLFSKTLQTDYKGHKVLIEWLPQLKEDTDIRLILNTHYLKRS